MTLLMTLNMMFGCSVCMVVCQSMVTKSQISFMCFLLVLPRFMQLLSLLMVLGSLTKMVSCFFMMIMFHEI